MDRRLQILLDAARYERLATEAERSGRSVAAIIREAIDLHFPVGDEDRIRVAEELLALTTRPDTDPGEGPAELKDALARELDDKLAAR